MLSQFNGVFQTLGIHDTESCGELLKTVEMRVFQTGAIFYGTPGI